MFSSLKQSQCVNILISRETNCDILITFTLFKDIHKTATLEYWTNVWENESNQMT